MNIFNKKKCHVCKHRFTISKKNIYTITEPSSLFQAFTKPAHQLDAIDCPRCGCQIALNVRLEKVSKVIKMYSAELTQEREQKYKRLRDNYLETCDNDCAGDDTVGIPPCPYYGVVEHDGVPTEGGCQLESERDNEENED